MSSNGYPAVGATAVGATQASPTSGRARRLLLIEDNPHFARQLTSYLRMAGYDVALATNGAEGMELLSRNRPELVLLDVLLPDRHGWEVCAQIKRDDTIPVIMLTALGQRDDKLTGLGVGADDYVTKPCSFEELEARVDALLRRTDFMAQAEGLGQPPT